MYKTILSLCLLFSFISCGLQKNQGIKKISIRDKSDAFQMVEEFSAPFADTLNMEIPLGFNIADLFLVLDNKKTPDITVENCYFTSMAISDEGPHLDLVDWKHYMSEWQSVKPDRNGYPIGMYTGSIDSEKFPDVTQAEIVSAIPESERERWMHLAKQCTSPQTEPCYVTISHYLVKISIKGSSPIFIRINIPMGC